MHINRTRSVSGLGTLCTVCVTGTVLAITLLAAVPAQADSIKFFSGTTGSTSPDFTTDPGTAYQSILATNPNTACAGGAAGNCNLAVDTNQAATINFLGGIHATGTGPAGTGAWYDTQPEFGGMGVGPTNRTPDSADQITVGETLLIHFNSAVQLTGIATLFDDGHTTFGASFPDGSFVTYDNTFLLNDKVVKFGDANAGLLAALSLGIIQDYKFQAIEGQPDFYVSGLVFSETPLPAAAWLFGGGLGLVAMLSGRRKRKQKSVWELTQNA